MCVHILVKVLLCLDYLQSLVYEEFMLRFFALRLLHHLGLLERLGHYPRPTSPHT